MSANVFFYVYFFRGGKGMRGGGCCCFCCFGRPHTHVELTRKAVLSCRGSVVRGSAHVSVSVSALTLFFLRSASQPGLYCPMRERLSTSLSGGLNASVLAHKAHLGGTALLA